MTIFLLGIIISAFEQDLNDKILSRPAHWHQVNILFITGIIVQKKSPASHSGKATRGGMMLQKKIVPDKVIEIRATEESLFQRPVRSSNPTWT